jgi:pentachlorophenol monooxygenase
LALTVTGDAAPGLLDTYDAERRPVGEEVVGRTVRSARDGIGADSSDPDFVIRREAQLLIRYDSPIVAPGAGGRAPDATGLTRDAVTGPMRLFTLLDRRDHTLLLYAGSDATDGDIASLEAVADAARTTAHDRIAVYLIAAPDADVGRTVLPLVRDAATDFARMYAAERTAVYVVRPDGYLSFKSEQIASDELVAHLSSTFGASVSTTSPPRLR